ncbi:hypothetical protein WICANDRAFT_53305 [Wickerhamomyces anomalus NRRL Y-366-8]|uniref:Copper transport protein n=1 Tax=Wickerhamomyces anomalus (strain ATCC 58044 / CBS 1984 / NCYC 433 / NRRL Y-366-8) TaxID=683960 RepID=A0A1E3P2T8_WICAA|nr:uncharacterized protein WICANDRAFT_53305 [Wickerhamomyces anomalus NRRL Y-366-8]ODQ59801.1 hypothetical protein WICANDRAFT_53305 [Wickerhamomyces anomalus NRRL Y-366-8]
MLFTWDWKNLCVVFRWWHVRSLTSFIVTLVALVVFGIGYEFFKSRAKRYEAKHQGVTNPVKIGSVSRIQKSVYYGLLVGYSYMMMLVFMTYNGWAMIAVVLGAVLGNYLYGGEINDSMACH